MESLLKQLEIANRICRQAELKFIESTEMMRKAKGIKGTSKKKWCIIPILIFIVLQIVLDNVFGIW